MIFQLNVLGILLETFFELSKRMQHIIPLEHFSILRHTLLESIDYYNFCTFTLDSFPPHRTPLFIVPFTCLAGNVLAVYRPHNDSRDVEVQNWPWQLGDPVLNCAGRPDWFPVVGGGLSVPPDYQPRILHGLNAKPHVLDHTHTHVQILEMKRNFRTEKVEIESRLEWIQQSYSLHLVFHCMNHRSQCFSFTKWCTPQSYIPGVSTNARVIADVIGAPNF